MIEITDIGDPRIAPYKQLRFTPALHTKERIFVTEGEKVTRKLLESGLEVVSIFALPNLYSKLSSLIEAKQIPPDSQFTASKELMDLIVGFRLHAGIMAIARQPDETQLERFSSRIVAFNGIVNSENVGAIVRNCAAFGIDSLIIDPQTSSPYMRRAVRVSMGAIFGMKIYRADDFPSTISMIRKKFSIPVISAEILNNSVSVGQFNFPHHFILVFGSEGYGVSPEVLDISDAVVHIPVGSNVDSLNVASASAVILYEAMRGKFH